MCVDPPYRNTTGYKFKFDPADFDRWILENDPSRTYVSEYSLPESVYDVIGQVPKRNTLGDNRPVMELLGKVRK